MSELAANFRLKLVRELKDRQEKNGAYSLRAFAASLGLSPATVSQIMSGKRPLTPKIAEQIADRLCLSPSERTSLLRSATQSAERLRITRSSGGTDDGEGIATESFKLIAEWQHFAILSLGSVAGNRADAGWIAERLGISRRLAEDSLSRLIAMGLVAVDERGGFAQTSKPLRTANDVADVAIRYYHRQTLERAAVSLDVDPVADREFGAMTMAIDPERLPEAKIAIREFRQRLSRLLESGRQSRVYTLSMQLFPIDRGEPKHERSNDH